MSQYRNLIVDQGSAYLDTVYVTDNDGEPFDLTGYVATMRMKKSYTSKTYVEFHTFISDAIKGEVQFWLDGIETENLKPIRYVYECVVKSDPELYEPLSMRIMEGIVTVTPSASI